VAKIKIWATNSNHVAF